MNNQTTQEPRYTRSEWNKLLRKEQEQQEQIEREERQSRQPESLPEGAIVGYCIVYVSDSTKSALVDLARFEVGGNLVRFFRSREKAVQFLKKAAEKNTDYEKGDRLHLVALTSTGVSGQVQL